MDQPATARPDDVGLCPRQLGRVEAWMLTPSSTYPIRRELRVLAYQAIVD